MSNKKKTKLLTTKNMVRISVLSVIGTILTIINISVPGFPPFLKLDLGNIPAVIGAITMGPLAAVVIELIKNLLKFIVDTSTAGIGELANFLIGISYIVPFGIIYKNKPNSKGFIIGATVGVILMTISAALLNYFVLIPMYAILMGGLDLIIDMSAAINSSITDLRTLILLAIVPFNIFKGVFVSIVGYALYKFLKPFINRL